MCNVKTLCTMALVLVFSLCFATNVFSQSSGNESLFHGLYVGGAIGYSGYDGDAKTDGLEINSISGNGINAGAFAGAGTTSNRFYYGLEANLEINTADSEIRSQIYDLDVEAKESYGVSARLGTLISESIMTYGLVGWQQMRLDASDSLGYSDDERLDGFQVGAGMEWHTNQNVFFRGQYKRVFYGSEDMGVTEVEAESDNFQIGVGFRF